MATQRHGPQAPVWPGDYVPVLPISAIPGPVARHPPLPEPELRGIQPAAQGAEGAQRRAGGVVIWILFGLLAWAVLLTVAATIEHFDRRPRR